MYLNHIDRVRAIGRNYVDGTELPTAAIFETREVNEDERSAVFEISNATVDRHCSVIVQEGIDFSHYFNPVEKDKSNPIVLFGHDYALGIGTSMWVKQEGDGLSKKTLAKIRFGKNDFAQSIMESVRDEIYRGASVGMIIKKHCFDGDARKRYRELYGVDVQDDSFDWLLELVELMEWSIVSVPSNRETLKRIAGMPQRIQDMTILSVLDEEFPQITKMLADAQVVFASIKSYEDKINEISKELETLKAGAVTKSAGTAGAETKPAGNKIEVVSFDQIKGALLREAERFERGQVRPEQLKPRKEK